MADVPKPGAHVWTLVNAGHRYDCELRFQAESSEWECRLLEDGELRYAWRFTRRASAEIEAEMQRWFLLREGWTRPVASPSGE
jgi:hypothetical protein